MPIPMPTEIEVLNYRFTAESASAILTAMLNMPDKDYSAVNELLDVPALSPFTPETIKKGVNELYSRGFLLSVEKPHGTVYAVNKLRIANMMFVYE